ncbi:MAG TPA: hypothetical protein VMS32_06875 [Verrucomicrobiae bacterium]|jgi:hypothetical protein|nr:hypothetical protein [Verrucomicrobiae bacterium]
MTRAAFVLALVALLSASFVAAAKSAPALLEIRNKTVYDLRFTIEPTNKTQARATQTLAPGATITFDQTGTWYLTGELMHGSTLIKKLGDHMILMKTGDRPAHLLAVDDPIAKMLRWYVYY